MSESQPASSGRRQPQQPALEGIDTNTRPMWAIAYLPLGSMLVGLIPASANGFVADTTPTGVVLNTLVIVLSIGLLVVGVVLAVADRRVLVGRGVVRPMHPAWEILEPVYVIGRGVVVHRRVRGSLNPLWVWIATSVVAGVINNLPR